MIRKVLGIFMVFAVMMFFAACDNETQNSNEENTDDGKNGEEADSEKENPDDDDEDLTKGDLSGCLGKEGEDYYPVPQKVSLFDKSKNKIVFYYQDKFYCAGNDFYYKAVPDETDKTLLNVYLKAVNINDGSIPGCDCPMRIGMEFSSEDHDLTNIEKIKIDYDFYWSEKMEDKVFSFEKINCFYNGKIYEEDNNLTDWCNLCVCTKYGDVACDEMYCGTCESGETSMLTCENDKEIEWCKCPDPEKGWECLEDPISFCEE